MAVLSLSLYATVQEIQGNTKRWCPPFNVLSMESKGRQQVRVRFDIGSAKEREAKERVQSWAECVQSCDGWAIIDIKRE